MTTTTSFGVTLATVFVLTGCLQDFDQYRGSQGGAPAGGGGVGGVGGVGAAGGMGAAGGGGAGGMTGGGGTGGAPECMMPDDCMVTECQVATCVGGECGSTLTPEGDPCPIAGDGVCNAAGSCVECITAAEHCTGQDVCANGFCVPPGCNDGMQNGNETGLDCGGNQCGPCPDGQGCTDDVHCQSGFCSANVCEPCGDGGDCSTNQWCDGATGDCTADLTQGMACTDDDQCPGDNCSDGFCCNDNCNDDCESCAAAETGGTNGVCSAIMNGTDPQNDCDGNGCFSNVCGGMAGVCGFDMAGSACGSGPSCSNAMLTTNGCNGMGSCQPTTAACPNNFVCANSSSCRTTCSSDSHCTTGFFCFGSQCVKKPDGEPCAASSECASNSCADDVCCNSNCMLLCQACDLPGTVGVCTDITSGDPDNECPDPPDNGDNCSAGNTCN